MSTGAINSQTQPTSSHGVQPQNTRGTSVGSNQHSSRGHQGTRPSVDSQIGRMRTGYGNPPSLNNQSRNGTLFGESVAGRFTQSSRLVVYPNQNQFGAVSGILNKAKHILNSNLVERSAISRGPMSAAELLNNKVLNKQIIALTKQISDVANEKFGKNDIGISARSFETHSSSLFQVDTQFNNIAQTQQVVGNQDIHKSAHKGKSGNSKQNQQPLSYETQEHIELQKRPRQKNNTIKHLLVFLIQKLQRVANSL